MRKIALRGATTEHGAEAILRTLWASRISSFRNGRRGLDRTMNLPQAFDIFDKKVAGPVSKHNREEEYPALEFWAPISPTLSDSSMKGRLQVGITRATRPRITTLAAP